MDRVQVSDVEDRPVASVPRREPTPWQSAEDAVGWQRVARGRHHPRGPKVRVTVQLDDDRSDWADQECERLGIGYSALILRLIDAARAKETGPASETANLGDTARPDLSITNETLDVVIDSILESLLETLNNKGTRLSSDKLTVEELGASGSSLHRALTVRPELLHYDLSTLNDTLLGMAGMHSGELSTTLLKREFHPVDERDLLLSLLTITLLRRSRQAEAQTPETPL